MAENENKPSVPRWLFVALVTLALVGTAWMAYLEWDYHVVQGLR